jgi:glycosyltransferase involved in cell wall biosynthesis
MPKSKVIIVGKLPPPYIGPAIATNIILNSALKNEFELLHLNTKVNQSLDDFGKGGVQKLFKNLSIYKNLIKLLRTTKPDLILIPISQTTIGFLKDSIFILIAYFFKTKILLQLRGSNFKNWMNSATSLTEKYVRFCFKKTNGMIVLGNNLKHLFEDYYIDNQIFVVPNGCDIELPPKRATPSVKILYFSNLLKSKGIRDVLSAVEDLQKRTEINFELNAVGAWYDSKFQKDCLRFVAENELPVYFHPPASGNEKLHRFADSDIFVFTPIEPEGHPWSIIEALSASLPIISTNQGAIIESVLDGKNGFIIESKSPNQIALKLETLLLDKKLRLEMGQSSLNHYKNNFTEKHMVANLTRVFKSI